MKAKILRNAAIALLMAGSLISCTNKSEDEGGIVTDPDAAILGKWELDFIYFVDTKNPQPPKGYMEYLPDGGLAWYDKATKKYTLFEEKYWVDDSYRRLNPPTEHQVEDGWVLHYEWSFKEFVDGAGQLMTIAVGPGSTGNLDLDKPHGFQFHLKFENSNLMRLESLDMSPIVGPTIFYYKRKK